ncbi:MAG: DUF3307 domain-containing protein [Anaerolineae bacterium]
MLPETLALSFFLRLLLGHLLGDFLLQPFWLVLLKREGWTGLLIHVTIVTAATAIVLWGLTPGWWIWIIALWVGHTFIDQFRTFVFTDTSQGKGFYLLVIDQFVHLLFITLLAWLAAGWRPSSLRLLVDPNAPGDLRLIAYLSGLVILMWVVPVVEVEFTMAMMAFQGAPSDKTLPIGLSDRLLGASERTISLLLIVLGLGFISPVAFAPRLFVMLNGKQDKLDRVAAFSKAGASFVTALSIGLILLFIPFPSF